MSPRGELDYSSIASNIGIKPSLGYDTHHNLKVEANNLILENSDDASAFVVCKSRRPKHIRAIEPEDKNETVPVTIVYSTTEEAEAAYKVVQSNLEILK